MNICYACIVSGALCNSFKYSDDMCIVVAFVYGLQHLLDTCRAWRVVRKHDIQYNTAKTFFFFFFFWVFIKSKRIRTFCFQLNFNNTGISLHCGFTLSMC